MASRPVNLVSCSWITPTPVVIWTRAVSLTEYIRSKDGIWSPADPHVAERSNVGFGNDLPDTPVMVEDFWNSSDENAHGGFQLFVANNGGKVEHWQRINDDILDSVPRSGEPGKWERVGTFGGGEVAAVWGLV
ncbi:hypothetical protein BKA63DRAFT_581253 [Paraphoma chrysanthemicola]|nr:hypothetical protein BKA63DRAFT_581253 [Paraphoma chrysanthemicola]